MPALPPAHTFDPETHSARKTVSGATEMACQLRPESTDRCNAPWRETFQRDGIVTVSDSVVEYRLAACRSTTAFFFAAFKSSFFVPSFLAACFDASCEAFWSMATS